MPRTLRQRGPDMWFHVFNRGSDRQDLFHDAADFAAFEQLVGDAVDEFAIEFHGLALMTNHFHALVHSADDVLTQSFHLIAGTYASRYNRRYERTGPLFDGRFRSCPIETDDHLLTVSRYVHRNPEAIVGPRALAAYRWSTFGAYTGSRSEPPWLTTGAVLDQFGGSRSRYRQFVEDGAECVDDVTPATLRPRGAMSDVERAVSVAAGVDVESLHRSRRGALNEARLVAILLIHERRLASSEEIAARFEMGTSSAARAASRRARALRSSEPSFRSLCERATALLAS